MPFVGSMVGGIVAWRYLGYATTRDAAILARRDVVRPHVELPAHHGLLSLADVEAHVGDPASVRWMKLAAILLHGRQSCVDAATRRP
jgi:hypothetical protein